MSALPTDTVGVSNHTDDDLAAISSNKRRNYWVYHVEHHSSMARLVAICYESRGASLDRVGVGPTGAVWALSTPPQTEA